jgi:bacillaene synthase trans-acting acyltransferase
MSDRQTVFMYSGQGSQYYGMGHNLYLTAPQFRAHVDYLDAMVIDLTDTSVVKLIFDSAKGAFDKFDDPAVTGVAIYLIERAITKLLLDHDIAPDIALGSSMGMFAASTVARCLDEEDAITCLYEQGKIVTECCGNGGMIAILAHPDTYNESEILKNSSEMVGINFENSFVISFPEAELRHIVSYLKQRGVVFQVMQVSRAYHSRWIDGAKSQILGLLDSYSYEKPALPIVCCSTAEKLTAVNPACLWQSMRNVMQFKKSIGNLERDGAYRYIDLGPSGTMATFLKYSLEPNHRSEVFSILTPFKQDNRHFNKMLTSFISNQ